ncbi:hypothetical protein J4413_01905 [Candidatus Woesearchaeota archaeon]|nr:hypothetical protein [Candidatus Woesearchaeota archaeon]
MKSGSNYIYVGIVLLIYIPLVFMGANVFFPKYTGPNSYYPYQECSVSTPDATRIDKICINEQEEKRIQFETEKNLYNSNKYIFIIVLSLVSLLIVSFLNIENIIKLGIFIGATINTFVSTLIYFDTKSKIGFGILVLIFILIVYYINKNKNKMLL